MDDFYELSLDALIEKYHNEYLLDVEKARSEESDDNDSLAILEKYQRKGDSRYEGEER